MSFRELPGLKSGGPGYRTRGTGSLRTWSPDPVVTVDGVARVTFESDAASEVLPVALVLTASYAALLLLHPVALAGWPGPATALVTSLCLVLAAGVAVLAARNVLPVGSGHGVLTLLVAVTAVAAAVHMVETSDPQATVPFLLVAVGTGAVLLDRSWFVAADALLWSCWTASAALVGGPASVWSFWWFYLAAATSLGVVIHLLRMAAVTISVGRSLLSPWESGDLERLLFFADRDMYIRRSYKGVPRVSAQNDELASRSVH